MCIYVHIIYSTYICTSHTYILIKNNYHNKQQYWFLCNPIISPTINSVSENISAMNGFLWVSNCFAFNLYAILFGAALLLREEKNEVSPTVVAYSVQF